LCGATFAFIKINMLNFKWVTPKIFKKRFVQKTGFQGEFFFLNTVIPKNRIEKICQRIYRFPEKYFHTAVRSRTPAGGTAKIFFGNIYNKVLFTLIQSLCKVGKRIFA